MLRGSSGGAALVVFEGLARKGREGSQAVEFDRRRGGAHRGAGPGEKLLRAPPPGPADKGDIALFDRRREGAGRVREGDIADARVCVGYCQTHGELAMPLAVTLIEETPGAWRAEVPSLPGIVAHGSSQDEARERARESAAAHLAARAHISWRDGWCFAHCLEMDVNNQGETEEEAREGLREHLLYYLSDDD
jgi:predicted RNase H-like HicB family nuclease